jgi:hypothetical protein
LKSAPWRTVWRASASVFSEQPADPHQLERREGRPAVALHHSCASEKVCKRVIDSACTAFTTLTDADRRCPMLIEWQRAGGSTLRSVG